MKQEKIYLLNQYRKKRLDTILEQYLTRKKDFKKLVRQKEGEENKKSIGKLRDLKGQDMWRHFKKKRTGGGIPTTIESKDITEYFYQLLNPKTEPLGDTQTQRERNRECELCLTNEDVILNQPIYEAEIEIVVGNFQRTRLVELMEFLMNLYKTLTRNYHNA